MSLPILFLVVSHLTCKKQNLKLITNWGISDFYNHHLRISQAYYGGKDSTKGRNLWIRKDKGGIPAGKEINPTNTSQTRKKKKKRGKFTELVCILPQSTVKALFIHPAFCVEYLLFSLRLQVKLLKFSEFHFLFRNMRIC